MDTSSTRTSRGTSRAAAGVAAIAIALLASDHVAGQEGYRFRSGVDLVNVTATVTDRSGRFVAGLRQHDFLVREDGRPVEIAHFSADRVPVSLGFVVDTSGSMAGEKWSAARAAIDRFLEALSDPEDEAFVYGFSDVPRLIEGWTSDRALVGARLGGVSPSGGTAMYDAVAEAVPMVQGGRNRKRALVIISDGNDTSSRIVRESEVLVYAVGIDGAPDPRPRARPAPPVLRPPAMPPFPFPGGRRGPTWPGAPRPPSLPSGGGGGYDPVNTAALRDITGDSGGRTEVVRSPRDLDPATAGIADELSRQYQLGYASPSPRDGRWHAISVDARAPGLRVRARRGFVATP